MTNANRGESAQTSRRGFLKATALSVLVGTSEIAHGAYVSGTDEIRIALIGCGGRGSGAAANALSTKANVKLVVMADAFPDRLEASLNALSRHPFKGRKKRVDVPKERQFTGLDAYQKAIDSDVDMVLLCTPPGFRPIQFEAAVNAGKHIFMEKPVATDAPGVCRIQAANAVAKKKGLLVAVGHHLRHETKHKEVVRRIHDGAIGKLKFLRAYFNSSGVWVRPRKADEAEMHYQVRNWYYFTWLSGDHIVEQHVHDLDVCNWIVGDHPVEAQGAGGRQVRIGKDYGEIFDHHSVEFTYADGTKLYSYSRHIPGCWNSFSEHAHGTKGFASIQGHGTSLLQVDGQAPMQWKRDKDGHQTEHDDLFAALVAGQPYNEADYGATSTMTAILGRMATYSGKIVPWDEAIQSDLNLMPKDVSWDAEPTVRPGKNGIYPCAMPGITKAW